MTPRRLRRQKRPSKWVIQVPTATSDADVHALMRRFEEWIKSPSPVAVLDSGMTVKEIKR